MKRQINFNVKAESKTTDGLHLNSKNTNISNSTNVYPEEEEHERESNEHSQQCHVLLHTELDSTYVEIVEDPNPPKAPDDIDLTNLDDKKEHNSGR